MHERKFKNALFICIVCSLGPQLLNDSIKFYKKIKCYFMGNSEWHRFYFRKIVSQLWKTLIVVTSKSGSISEPRNTMKKVENAFYKKEGNYTRRKCIVEIY